MSQKTKTSRSKRCLSPIGESDDEDFKNALNVLLDECMTKIDEAIEWVVDFCDKTTAENKDRRRSPEEDLKEDDSESDIHPAFRRNRMAVEDPLIFNGRAGATIIQPRPMKTGQRTHHDGHRHTKADTENPRRVKRAISLEDTRSIHEEGKAEFNKARSGSTGNRRKWGITREVIGRFESVKRTLNPSPSRLLPLDPPSSSASTSRKAHTLPPLRPASPLTLVDYDDDFSARTIPLRRLQNQGQKARNYGTNDDVMRRISYGETAITPPIPSPHRVSVKKQGGIYGTNDDAMRRLSYGETAATPPTSPPHRVSVKKKAGIPCPSEDAQRASSHSETLAPLRRPTHTEQEPRASHTSDDTVRRRRRQTRLVTKEDGA